MPDATVPLINSALRSAMQAHLGQVDKQGVAYIAHVMAVTVTLMRQGQPGWVVAAGALHDTIEDTGLTREDLRDMGFPEDTTWLVETLSRRSTETYSTFIGRIIEAGREAIVVKLADIGDNLGRIDQLDGDARRTLEGRYVVARERLMGALHELDGSRPAVCIYHETPEEREERGRKASERARKMLRLTKGQAKTLRRARRRMW